MIKKIIYIFLLFMVCVALLGCSTIRKPGFPIQSFNTRKDVQVLESNYGTHHVIEEYNKIRDEEERGKLRNRIIRGRIALIDLNYMQFVGEFSSTKQALDTVTNWALTGVGLAGTAVSSAAAKTTYAAISSGLSASKLAIDKNYFYEKTTPVLITSMNAERKKVLVTILQNMEKSTHQYPLSSALSDLYQYYLAGTFVGGLQSIQEDAGEKVSEFEIVLDKLRTSEFVEPEKQNRIDKILDHIENLSNEKAINLVTNPPVNLDSSMNLIVQTRDPQNKRFKNGSTAKSVLKQIVTIGQRSEEVLNSWEKTLGIESQNNENQE